ncbi:hypothetical protein [Fuscovulum blasticum]|uniref:hypothetical protein n=1 Tax=Fuscovulum blasticum TaxID=1075 RepID=UPI000D3E35AA|nr:hypothetical protein [Fuscovulum blasticum]AWD22280.1 hypothetical protein B6K69_11810 [Fuscovulum blasticum]
MLKGFLFAATAATLLPSMALAEDLKESAGRGLKAAVTVRTLAAECDREITSTYEYVLSALEKNAKENLSELDYQVIVQFGPQDVEKVLDEEGRTFTCGPYLERVNEILGGKVFRPN